MPEINCASAAAPLVERGEQIVTVVDQLVDLVGALRQHRCHRLGMGQQALQRLVTAVQGA